MDWINGTYIQAEFFKNLITKFPNRTQKLQTYIEAPLQPDGGSLAINVLHYVLSKGLLLKLKAATKDLIVL